MRQGDQEADDRPDGRPDHGASGEVEDPASGSRGPWTEGRACEGVRPGQEEWICAGPDRWKPV